jgi:hypothetical protein
MWQELRSSLEQSRKAIEQEKAAVRKPVTARRVSNVVRCSANPLSTLRIGARDAQVVDAQHLHATRRQMQPNGSVTVTTVDKWISEATAHMPSCGSMRIASWP